MAKVEVSRLADQLERSFRGGPWHGPALLEAVDGVDAELAGRRPIPDAHSIGEIVAHLSAWIEICRRRIDGTVEPGAEPDDWPAGDGGLDEDGWQGELARLDERHRRLLATVRGLDDERLDAPVPGSDPTVRGLLLGILQHHAYHGGQIVLLKRAAGVA